MSNKAENSPIIGSSKKADVDKIKVNDSNLNPIFKSTSGRFESTDLNKNPSYTSRNLKFSKDSKVHQQAFSLLSNNSTKSLENVTTVMSSLDAKKDKIEFIKACYEVESSGSNPVMHPRPKVMDYLRDSLLDLGVKTGISSVKAEEPIVDNVEPVRFAL